MRDRVGGDGVHEAHRGVALLLVGILWSAQLTVGVVKVGQGDRRLEENALIIDVEQEPAELVTDPQRPVGGPLERLDVEVGAREDALVAEVVADRERDTPVGVAQLHVLDHRDAARAAPAVWNSGRRR
jgi:hypothetical protein